MDARIVRRKRKKNRLPLLLLIIIVVAGVFWMQNHNIDETGSYPTSETEQSDSKSVASDNNRIYEDGEYNSSSDVAEYIHLYHHLPSNYVTKDVAESKGWHGGNPMDSIGKCIGGDYYGNYEGLLPDGDYRECDVDYDSDERGPCRLVFDSSGNIYLTEDHYDSFRQLY